MSTDAQNNAGAQVWLASTSPRRAQLLTQIGVRYRRHSVAVDESMLPGETPQQMAQRLACLKVSAGRASLRSDQQLPLLAADTLVVVDGQVLGKPESEEHAISMLLKLSGGVHQVLSAVAVMDEGRTESCLVETQVRFRELSREECQRYWNTGEPRDKAGAYGIQGYGALLVVSIEGSYSNVVGLPLLETAQMLGRFGVTVWNEVGEQV